MPDPPTSRLKPLLLAHSSPSDLRCGFMGGEDQAGARLCNLRRLQVRAVSSHSVATFSRLRSGSCQAALKFDPRPASNRDPCAA
jgi:hypothetical protein